MDSLNFCYWLQGFIELQDPKELTPEQVQMIKDHLSLVFLKVTPVNLPKWTTPNPKDFDWVNPNITCFTPPIIEGSLLKYSHEGSC